MKRKQKKPVRIKHQLLSFDNLKSPQAEAFRTLRTNLQFTSLDKDIKTILVTSSLPNEGKTTVASNLALALAQTEEQEVLLIDADLRNPTINRLFSIDNDHGLTNLLLQDKSVEQLFYITLQKHLTVLSSGPVPPNPAELLASRRMQEAMDFLQDKFDRIIVDSPPVMVAADASVLASRLDGVLLVVGAGTTDRNACLEAKEQLLKVNASLLGVVLNKVTPNGSSYYSNYYYAPVKNDIASRF